MKRLEFDLRFSTPAFLGDADQEGRWRTPPFKALLRQWWRVAYAAAHRFDVDVGTMRKAEGGLFGAAANDTGTRSRVRLRLSRWDAGTLRRWEPMPNVVHPEVRFPVDSGLYLGYGPVVLPKGQKQAALKSNAAIQAGEAATLGVAYPEEAAALVESALALIARYGTLGGRSRNGWGSFSLHPLPPGEGWGEGIASPPPSRPWRDCLDRDWPHALGADEQGALIWRTDTFEGWSTLMRALAEIKIGLRTQFPFRGGNNTDRPESRHWLSHPVTNHNVRPWRQGRLPNSLRFKARAEADGKLRGVVFHVPCLPPPQFRPDRAAVTRVWEQVHGFLDGRPDLRRSAS